MKGDFWIQLDWHCIDLHLVRIWNQYFSIGFSLPIEILFSIGRGLVMHCPELAQHWHSGTPANRTNPMQMLQSFTNREKAPDENRQHWQRIGECRPEKADHFTPTFSHARNLWVQTTAAALLQLFYWHIFLTSRSKTGFQRLPELLLFMASGGHRG